MTRLSPIIGLSLGASIFCKHVGITDLKYAAIAKLLKVVVADDGRLRVAISAAQVAGAADQ